MSTLRDYKAVVNAFGLAYWIVGWVVSIIITVLFILGGNGFFAGIGVGVILCCSVLFGAHKEIIASFILGSLMKLLQKEIISFCAVWLSGETMQKLVAVYGSTSYTKLILIVFFFIGTLAFVSNAIGVKKWLDDLEMTDSDKK